MKRFFSDTQGGALVEVALSAPLMVVMMVGAFELGRLAHHSIEVENAARAGSSYGSMNTKNATINSATIIQAAQNDAPDLANLTVQTNSTCVCETLNTSSGTATFNPSSGTVACTNAVITSCTAESATSVQIAISYVRVTSTSNVSSVFPGAVSLNGYSLMRVLPN